MTEKTNQQSQTTNEQELWRLAKLLREKSREISRQLNEKKTR